MKARHLHQVRLLHLRQVVAIVPKAKWMIEVKRREGRRNKRRREGERRIKHKKVIDTNRRIKKQSINLMFLTMDSHCTLF